MRVSCHHLITIQCIAELKYKAGVFKNNDYVEALDGVFKSDTIVPEDVRLALINAVKSLEELPEDQKDWHPRSDGKVLDLVHPSLYPLVYGQTRLLPLMVTSSSLDTWRGQLGLGDKSESQSAACEDHEEGAKWSALFQWLPCEVDVSEKEPKIVSYINNLHPQNHHKLYLIIEQIIQRSMVLWESTLTSIRDRNERPTRIMLSGDGYGEPILPRPNYPMEDENLPWEEYNEQEEAWRDSRPILQPEPDHFKPFTPQDPVDLRTDYLTRRLQIIVKLATIHLTPSSPTYDGGTWHVEGAANESICASAIYYYQSDNISESLLAFRQRAEDDAMDLEYEQDDHRALETIYGFRNGDPLIQNLGKVVTREGRLITFPNALQHCVEPFSLEDRTKPGYRKILALFLVDPNQRIISTANVAPQQPEWWDGHLKLSEIALQRLPQELKDAVKENFPPMMGPEEAKEVRERLMDQRSAYANVRNREIENWASFSLCEH